MASSHDDEKELSGGEDMLIEECIEEDYGLDNVYTSSSTHLSFVELPSPTPAPAAVKTIKSSSDVISSVIPSFKSSSSLKSTYPPASWPSDGSRSELYLQSSGGVIEGLMYADFEPSSSEPEVEVKISKAQVRSKTSVKRVISKSDVSKEDRPKETTKKSRCIPIPYLHDVLDYALCQEPFTNIHYVEKLKISIDRFKILSDSTLNVTTRLLLPEDDFAGDFTLNVEDINSGIFIESYSYLKDGDYTNGTQVFSKLTKEFTLVEEKRTEFQYNEFERKEKSMHVFVECRNYIAYCSNKCNEEEQKYRGCITLQNPDDFILDGSLYGLTRHLIAINFTGCFQCFSITVSGRICREVFCIDEKKYMQVNHHLIEVILLRKSTYDYCTKKKIEMSETYFLPTGSMLYHTWKHSPYIIHIDPLLLGNQKKLNPCMELTWKSDSILYSMFEFEKEYSHCLLQKFLDNYPEVIELLNDYIISLFHEKPQSVVKFTCDFFERT